MLKTEGIIIEIEVRTLVFARIEYLHAVIAEVLLAEDRAEDVVGCVGQLNVVMLAEELVEDVLLGYEVVPEVYKLDADMFFHNFIFVLRIYHGSTLKEMRMQWVMSTCNRRSL